MIGLREFILTAAKYASDRGVFAEFRVCDKWGSETMELVFTKDLHTTVHIFTVRDQIRDVELELIKNRIDDFVTWLNN